MQPTLILVDIQNDYFPQGRMEVVGAPEACGNAKAMLAFFRDRHWPVLHIQHISTRKGAAFFLPGTEGVKIHPAVAPRPDEIVIHKNYPNSFRETSLQSQLQQNASHHLVICGMMSHMCIDTTVRAAFDYGYSCTVLHDACATRNLEFAGTPLPAASVHAAYMAGLSGLFAQVVPTSDAMQALHDHYTPDPSKDNS